MFQKVVRALERPKNTTGDILDQRKQVFHKFPKSIHFRTKKSAKVGKTRLFKKSLFFSEKVVFNRVNKGNARRRKEIKSYDKKRTI